MISPYKHHAHRYHVILPDPWHILSYPVCLFPRSTPDPRSAPGMPTPFSMSSTQRRAVAAALRDALAGGCDSARLEAALFAAEEAGLEAALLSKARLALSQRKKKEKEKERMMQQVRGSGVDCAG